MSVFVYIIAFLVNTNPLHAILLERPPNFITPWDLLDDLEFNYETIEEPELSLRTNLTIVEGDIAIPLLTTHRFDHVIDRSRSKRNAMNPSYFESDLWKDGKVYYEISSSYGTHHRNVIAKAMREIESHTCIRFVPNSDSPLRHNKQYVRILQDTAESIHNCYSLVGRSKLVYPPQPLSLTISCLNGGKGVVIHELLHAIGFYHEHTRHDRDQHIQIHFDNIDPNDHDQFVKHNRYKSQDLGTEYDYGSIMHYGAYDFAKSSWRRTITVKGRTGVQIGQRVGLSSTDIVEINKLYNCQHETGTVSCEDKGKGCRRLKSMGFCTKIGLREYTLKRCKKTCGACYGEHLTTAVPTEVTTEDTVNHATKPQDDTRPTESVPSELACLDDSGNCHRWATLGYCKKFDYTRQQCKGSCDLCETET